ncbi:MAG: hypothetical protein JNL80_15490 [Phycisphaerae bacterium]|jgi:hypothetical protein|nr:hypothetical protein [Phycisphaerae bacterium]
MRILLDDRETGIAAKTIGEAVASAATMAERDGRQVVDVYVDGEEWTEDQLSSPDRLRQPAEEVRVTSIRPAELVRETFVHAASALLEAEQMQRSAAKLMRADQAKDGLDVLMQALSVWVNIHKATVQGIQFARIDPRTITTPDGTFEEAAGDLNRKLISLRDAMQGGDTVAVCDCLLYEFPATTKRWASMLAELARRADAMLKDG